MNQAVEAVTKNGMPNDRAARLYGVPPSTLHDRISGRVAVDASVGGPKELTKAEEDCLVEFIIHHAMTFSSENGRQRLAAAPPCA